MTNRTDEKKSPIVRSFVRAAVALVRGLARKDQFAGQILIGLTLTLVPPGAGRAAAQPYLSLAQGSEAVRREALEAYGKLPLSFIPNAGQANARVRYYAHAPGYNFAFTPKDAFVTKLNAVGSALLYSTYLGGISKTAALKKHG